MPLRGYIFFLFGGKGYDGPWLRGSRRLVLGFLGRGMAKKILIFSIVN